MVILLLTLAKLLCKVNKKSLLSNTKDDEKMVCMAYTV